ncbi:hypothetical protein CC78DRAFT_549618 [Lojkania enalia]|uniref:MARVEL domain-containing protein n=1 Tax=Lojkania enalia TaxID=147567 RepID=A0A9P4N0M1_9PLEO|nr:hypothetical protein CC78DRAFT_549618 [Didymosphaeria enalia]
MAYVFTLPIRIAQAVLSIIILGLTAYIIDTFSTPFGSFSPDSVDFMLFTSLWTLLAVGYLVFVAMMPDRIPVIAHKYAVAAVEAVTMIFWFAAWVAVAAKWGDINWPDGYEHPAWWSSGVAAIVFGCIVWLTFVATTVMSALHIRNSARSDTAPPPQQMQAV